MTGIGRLGYEEKCLNRRLKLCFLSLLKCHRVLLTQLRLVVKVTVTSPTSCNVDYQHSVESNKVASADHL